MSAEEQMAAVLRDPEVQALARERFGVPLLDCTPMQAVSLLTELAERHEREAVRLTAGIDQAEALLSDVARCGCTTIAAQVDDDGRPVLATGRIVHTCGRRS